MGGTGAQGFSPVGVPRLRALGFNPTGVQGLGASAEEPVEPETGSQTPGGELLIYNNTEV